MAIADDFSVAVNGDIRYTGAAHGAAGAGYYTVIEMHRFLQDLADDAVASGDDLVDITSATPSDRSTDNIITLINGYNIDDAAAEHLYDGSIIQEGGDTIYDGLVVLAAEGMDLQIIQNGAIIVNDFWNTIPDGETAKGLNRLVSAGTSHRFMLKVRTEGGDIDGRRIVGLTRELGFTYSEFKSTTNRGNNVLALSYASDLNNATASGTIAGWSGDISITQGYQAQDYNNDTSNEFYYIEWARGARGMNDLYEYSKYVTRRGETALIFGLEGQLFRGITHEVTYGSLAGGTFTEGTYVAFANGATAQVLADDGSGKMWVQVLTGVIPSSGGMDDDIVTVTATVTGSAEYTVPANVIGVSTGSAIIGARGVGVDAPSNNETLFDLDDNLVTPPNNVTFTVSGLISGEDRVLVTPESGGDIDVGQFVTSGALSGGEGTVVVATGTETAGTGQPNASDTPTAGVLRVADDAGVYHNVAYTGFTAGAGSLTFTGCTGTPAATSGNNAYLAYIDELATGTSASFTAIYGGSDRALYVRVRDGDATPIKTFETPSTLGSSGGGTTAIRTSDA